MILRKATPPITIPTITPIPIPFETPPASAVDIFGAGIRCGAILVIFETRNVVVQDVCAVAILAGLITGVCGACVVAVFGRLIAGLLNGCAVRVLDR
jgi:hypothetical protein